MPGSSRINWGKVLRIAGATACGAYAGAKLARYLQRSGAAARLGGQLAEGVDHTVGWDRLPPILGLLELVGLRSRLRAQNLHDTSPPEPPSLPPPGDAGYRTARTVDGTYNDLEQPWMGSAGTRFGRNVPRDRTHQESEARLLEPSPRVVSRELLTRHQFLPATSLNLLAAAWLQFMVRDWLSHGESDEDHPWRVPLAERDSWHEDPMRIPRTRRDPPGPGEDPGLPPAYANTETHWWDASQLYGSTLAFQNLVRARMDGKLRLGPEHLVQPDPTMLTKHSNLAGWWVGLALFFTLFTLEHNAICDRLRAEYPSWSDDDLFDRARLINAALLAKIHTVEWTPAILGHPTLHLAMRANWWGVASERIHRLLGRVSRSELVSGIPGSATDHFGVPYAITEEFVAVYRMHPLVPDEYVFYSVADGRRLHGCDFTEVAGKRSHVLMERVAMPDLLYSFGLAHPGAITLHNYPRFLQRFERPDGTVIDVAAHDILRSREFGVPRYNEFRQLLHRRPVRSFAELSDNPQWVEELRRVYADEVDRVDLMVGLYGERLPRGFGFSDTAFRIFILMASRRLNSDRFFTTDFTPAVYTSTGMQWIDDNTLATVLLRHYPSLTPALSGVLNPFAPWSPVSA